MVSRDIERKLPHLPAEIWSKILAELSIHRDYGEFVHLWTHYRHVSSIFKNEVEKNTISQTNHYSTPTIYLPLSAMLTDLLDQEIFKASNMSAEEMMEKDKWETWELADTGIGRLPLRFHQLSPNKNEITFIYKDVSIETDGWPEFEHLCGKSMIRPLTMWAHPTLQHLPAQVEWINRNERVTLSLTFDWKQLFSTGLYQLMHGPT